LARWKLAPTPVPGFPAAGRFPTDVVDKKKGRIVVELDALPIEVDLLDWADQHRLVPLSEDDYPHVVELERVTD
jgi:hypothetical protein